MSIFNIFKRKKKSGRRAGKEEKSEKEPEKLEVKKAVVAADKKPVEKPAKKSIKKPVKKQSKSKAVYLDAHRVLSRPIVTEKSLAQQAQGKYSFFVSREANKNTISMAVQSVYGVTPLKVNVIKSKPRELKRWGRKTGMRKGSKKAIVTVPEGKTLS